MRLIDIVEEFPDELRKPIANLIEFMRSEELKKMSEEMEEGFKKLTESINKLTEAQERTEERLNKLERVVEELAQAQKRTEERLNRLERVVEELAQAQKRTEERLNELIREHAITREKVENLSHNFGFLLEDRAIQSLPNVLKDRGFEVERKLRTKRIEYGGKEYMINIYGVVRRENRRYVLFGESKSRVSKKEIRRFVKLIERLKDKLMAEENADGIYPIVVIHRIDTKMEKFLKEENIDFVESYLLKI